MHSGPERLRSQVRRRYFERPHRKAPTALGSGAVVLLIVGKEPRSMSEEAWAQYRIREVNNERLVTYWVKSAEATCIGEHIHHLVTLTPDLSKHVISCAALRSSQTPRDTTSATTATTRLN